MNMSHRVLIVDDEQAINFALSEYFTLRGYHVDSAVTVAEAEALLCRGSYEVLITDLSLGGRGSTEGLELVALVRQRRPRTRTVILTAYGSAESEAAARQLGVDAFLEKPTPPGEIARVLDRLMRESGARSDRMDQSGATCPAQAGRAEPSSART